MLLFLPWLWPLVALSAVYPPSEPAHHGNVIDLDAEKRRRAARPARRL